MTTKTIEVEGLPEGCEAVAVQFEPNYFNKYTGYDGYIYFEAKVKVKKIQSRRIVLEETNEVREAVYGDWIHINGFLDQWRSTLPTPVPCQIWREVTEVANDESRLSLSIDECKGLFEGHQPTINKVKEFIKDK